MNCCKEPKFFPLWDRLSGCLPLILGALALLLLMSMCRSAPPQFTTSSPNTMTLEGVAGADECVEIYEGDKKLGETKTGADGKFSFKLPAGLTAGAHTFTGKVTCGPGLRWGSVALAPLTFNVPAPPTPAPTAVPPTAVPPTAVPTAVPPTAAPTATPTPAPVQTSIDAIGAGGLLVGGQLTGKAEKNCDVAIFNGTTELGKATADATGIWKFILPSSLKAGDYNLKAVCAKSESSVLSVKMTEPVPTSIDAVGAAGLTAGGQLSGKAEKNCDVAIFNGTTELGKVTADATGIWKFILPSSLKAGDYNLKAVCAKSESSALSVKLAEPVPTTIDAIANNAIQFGGKLTGKSAKDCEVVIMDGSAELGKAKADAAGVWSFALPTTIGVGEHSFKAICDKRESAVAALRVVALLPVTGDSE
ncbi:MAG: hypothetical protein KIH69_013870 [Anaerolineae bacterium]|nr:hypothetical protein [Anaerolineae bacterium]